MIIKDSQGVAQLLSEATLPQTFPPDKNTLYRFYFLVYNTIISCLSTNYSEETVLTLRKVGEKSKVDIKVNVNTGW